MDPGSERSMCLGRRAKNTDRPKLRSVARGRFIRRIGGRRTLGTNQALRPVRVTTDFARVAGLDSRWMLAGVRTLAGV
jgi:hypothetical protein